jgi:Na+/H+-dicarboxylate symporter
MFYNQVIKFMSDIFPVHNPPKQGDALPLLIFSFSLGYAIGKLQVKRRK